MIRSEIRNTFRVENPEIDDRVATDVELNSWLLQGDKEVCAITRCIVSDFVITSVTSTSVYDTKYDLTDEEPKFFDIDEMPGGGVSFDDEPLEKTSVSELDADNKDWRKRNAGTPEKWYRRGKWLYFDYPVLTEDLDIRVYAVLVSDDFNDDNIMPFNQLSFLEPYHQVLLKYLQWKAKEKVGKPEEGMRARQEFLQYAEWMKKMISGNKISAIRIQPK